MWHYLCHSPLITQKRGLHQLNKTTTKCGQRMKQNAKEGDLGVRDEDTGQQETKGRKRRGQGDQGEKRRTQGDTYRQREVQKETVSKKVHQASGRGCCREIIPRGPVCERTSKSVLLQTRCLQFPAAISLPSPVTDTQQWNLKSNLAFVSSVNGVL